MQGHSHSGRGDLSSYIPWECRCGIMLCYLRATKPKRSALPLRLPSQFDAISARCFGGIECFIKQHLTLDKLLAPLLVNLLRDLLKRQPSKTKKQQQHRQAQP